MRRQSKYLPLYLVLGVFFILALIYNFTIPLGKGPDEPDHYAYVKWLVRHHSLPPINDRDMMRERTTGAIAMHPPLAHVIHAIGFTLLQWLPDETIQHLLRAWSAVLCTLTLLVAYRLTREIFPENAVLPLAVMAFIAFLPHFQLIASVISTDPLLILLNSLLLWLMVRTLRTPHDALRMTHYGWLGALYGVILITKSSALSFAPLGAVIAAAGWRRDGVVGWLKKTAAFYVPALVIASWWFIRFYNITGRWHPINPRYEGYERNAHLISHSLVDFLTRRDALALLWRHVEGVFISVWGQVDWSYPTLEVAGVPQAEAAAYPLTVAFLRLFTALTAVSLVGLIVLLGRTIRQSRGSTGGRRSCGADSARQEPRPPEAVSALGSAGASPSLLPSLLLVVAHFALIYFALMHYTLFVHPGGYQAGRYLYPSVCALGLLFVAGLLALCPQRWHAVVTIALSMVLLCWNVACLVNLKWFLIPFYGHG
ncbi:MAG: hypothetical protein NZT92_08370 [Abditibacteriales bacterium]|nr:hypothetical protein [Abditibacteriales bacterium]MDW8364730.1 hypothetical protein [Abditibacteriales bacterium]